MKKKTFVYLVEVDVSDDISKSDVSQWMAQSLGISVALSVSNPFMLNTASAADVRFLSAEEYSENKGGEVMSMNKVILNGRLTRDPEMKTLPGAGTKVCNFGMAMSSKYKNKDQQLVEETTFVDLAAFGRTGEVIEQYFHRGDGVLIEGRLKLDQWEKDGQKRSKLSVVVQSFSFPEGKKSDQSGNSQTAGAGPVDEF